LILFFLNLYFILFEVLIVSFVEFYEVAYIRLR